MYLGRVPITIVTQYVLFERALCLNWQPNCDNKIKKQKLLHGKINSVCGNVLFVSDNAGDFDDKKILTLKNFFKDKEYKVTLAEYVGKDDILLDFTENGEAKSLVFNLVTGESNVLECIDLNQ